MDENQVKKLFGKRLKELRKTKNLTQEKLSEYIFMDPQHYCKMENGNHFPSLKNIIKLAEILDVDIKEFFTFQDTENNKLIRNLNYNMKILTNDELKFIDKTINSLLELRKTKESIYHAL